MIRFFRRVTYATILGFLILQQSSGDIPLCSNSSVVMTKSLSYVYRFTLVTIETMYEIIEQFGRNPVLKCEETANRKVVCENNSQTMLMIVLGYPFSQFFFDVRVSFMTNERN